MPPVELTQGDRGNGPASRPWRHFTAALLMRSPLGSAHPLLRDVARLPLPIEPGCLAVPDGIGFLAMTNPIARPVESATDLNPIVGGRWLMSGDVPLDDPAHRAAAAVVEERGPFSYHAMFREGL
jgi:hypothetical protein